MAAVIAAIGAALLAGAVAFFREHRLQQRRLIVASRGLLGTFELAKIGLTTALDRDEWQPLNLVPSEESFASAWEESRTDLAAHVPWEEWRYFEVAAREYLVLRLNVQDKPPSKSREAFESVIGSISTGADRLKPYAERRLSLWAIARRKLGSRGM